MVIRLRLFLISIVLFIQCGGNKAADYNSEQRILIGMKDKSVEEEKLIDGENAIKIAKKDAIKTYGSVEQYRIVTCEQRRLWRILFAPEGGNKDGLEYAVVKLGGWIASSEKYTYKQPERNNRENAVSQSLTAISKESAINITKKDAAENNEPPEMYNVVVCELPEVWRVIYDAKDNSEGGGPDFIVDKKTGEIIHKMYYQ